MQNIQCCFIREEFFKEHPDYINMLDPNNIIKQSKRTHLCILVKVNNNKVFIPLRNNLGNPIRKFGKIGFPVPSTKRPNAGLDYRYSLIINDDSYIEYHEEAKIPTSQYKTIEDNYKTISDEINTYVNRYIKVANKHREQKEPLFRESSLINFHKELGITKEQEN